MTLQEQLQSIAAAVEGTLGLAVRSIATGEEVRLHDQELFPLASVFKVPLIVELFNQVEEGRVRLDDRVTMREEDIAPGSGVLRELAPGVQMTVRDLAVLATIISDNTAADMLFRLLDGARTITASMQRVGLQQTAVPYDCKALLSLYAGLPPYDRSPEAAAELRTRLGTAQLVPDPRALETTLNNNCATPSDMMDLFTLMVQGELISATASESMLDILLRQQLNQRIPLLLPAGAKVAHKTGTLGPTRNDAGIIYLPNGDRIIFCALSKGTNPTEGQAVDQAIARAARAVWDHYTA